MDISSFILGLKMGGGGGGGSSVTVESLSVTENGTTTAPTGKAYSPVVVNVPNSYSAGDEGKVVSNGALVSQTSDTVTQNGTVDTTLINSLLVNVSGGGGAWSWLGRNPYKLQEWTEHKKFSETDFATWTYSTTQTTISAAASYSPTIAANCADYDYVQVVKLTCHYDYGNWTPLNAMLDFSFTGTNMIFGWCSSDSAIQAGVPNETTSGANSDYYATYTKQNGTTAISSGGYGLYATVLTNPTITPPSSLTPTLTFMRPNIYARGSSTYFTSDAFSHLDMEASYYDLVSEIWRVDAETSFRGALRTDIMKRLK